VLLAILPACNFVLGNEEGVLEDPSLVDGSQSDPDGGETIDSEVEASDDSEGSATDPEASDMEGSITQPDDATSEAQSDAPRDRSDATKLDAAHRDADGNTAVCDTGVSVCADGQVATDMQACGPCGRGMQTRKRTCLPDGCGWSAWTAWSTCTVLTAECMPGQTGSESQACGPCNTGTQARTRACTNTCTWGAWSDFGACGNITAECMPNHWRCCGAGKWEWCYTNSCTWTGGCAACTGCGC
jgi:hypothetical protein